MCVCEGCAGGVFKIGDASLYRVASFVCAVWLWILALANVSNRFKVDSGVNSVRQSYIALTPTQKNALHFDSSWSIRQIVRSGGDNRAIFTNSVVDFVFFIFGILCRH